MNKRIITLLLLIFSVYLKAHADTVLVAPVIVYDKDSNVIKLPDNPCEKIYEKLSSFWFEGLVEFKKLSARDYGEIYTLIDANRVCSAEKSEYILFGYIKKNDGNWFCDIKLYSSNLKKITGEYYASDDISHSERLFNNLCENIIEGLTEITGITGLEGENKNYTSFKMKLPVTAFYWTPVDYDWNKKMLGIAGGEIGIDLYPPVKKVTLNQKLLDYSIRPAFSYSYAMEKDGSYPLRYHGISFVLPLLFHLHLNKSNAFYAGTGPYYEIELLNVQPLYENETFCYQNIFGLESLLGYEFSAGKVVNLFTEVKCDFHFNKDTFISIKPSLGISFNLGGKKE